MASFISHFTHTEHKLVKTLRETPFTCDVCKMHGMGVRYRCEECDFDLHEHCSVCPGTLPSFFAHPRNPLTLSPPPSESRFCDICREPVNGYSYRCQPCGFDLHPLCSLIAHTARTMLHTHALTLIPDESPINCSWCRERCLGWRYCCRTCGLDLHRWCVHGSPPYGTTSNSSAGGNDTGGDGGGGGDGESGGRGHTFTEEAGLKIVTDVIISGISSLLSN